MNKKKNEEVPLIIPILLIVVLVGVIIYGAYSYFKNKADLSDDPNDPTVVDTNSNNVIMSFDKSRYSCVEGESFEVKIYVSEEAGNINSYTSTSENIATIDASNASDVYCLGCTVAKIDCKSNGNTDLKVTTEKGYSATTNINVLSNEVEVEESKIMFDKSSYSCNVGEKVSARITVQGESADKVTYSSSEKNIATIEKKSINGENINVQITCKNDGSVTLNAKTEKGVETSASVEVKKVETPSQSTAPSEGSATDSSIGTGTITFDQSSYSCEEGEKITTTITAGTTVSSYTSSNTSIATIEKHPTVSVKCINCVAVQITCKKSGNVSLTATSSDGAKTTAKVTVKSVEEQIFFDKTSYSCKAGEKVSATITALGNFRTKVPMVESFKSENEDVAKLIKHPDYAIKCINCVAVQIVCNKAGTTTLSAVSTTGAKGRASLTVSEATKAKISFDKSSYSCTAGEKITTTITAYGNGSKPDTVASYTSSDKSIATIEKHPTLAVKCINCVAVQITCKKKGNVTLTAKSSSGAKGSATVKVATKPTNSITFDKSSYSCKAGEKITATVTINNTTTNMEHIESYASSDTSIATIQKHPTVSVKCMNCIAVQITCKKKGNVTVSAKGSAGTVGKATVKVSGDTEKVYFDKSTYGCMEGEKITTTLKTSGVLGARIASYTSNNTSVAVVEKHPTLAVDCVNCVAVQITCKKSGSAVLTGKSTTGATGSSTVTVYAQESAISFDKGSYSCKPGEKITTTITASGALGTRVASYTSNNTNVATVEKHPTLAVNCINCVAVQITCKSAGTATLTAKSTEGATGSSSVSVTSTGVTERIKFDKNYYSCRVGEKIDATISAEGSIESRVASYTSADTSVATIEKHPTLAVKCINCVAVQITCKKAGTTKLTAESTKHAKMVVSINVTD